MEYSTLKKQILSDISRDEQLRKKFVLLKKQISNNAAKYSDVVEFTKILGKTTSKYLKQYGLPETEIGVYAEEIIAPVYRSMQKTATNAAKSVQNAIYKNNRIGLAAADVPLDESRILHIVERFKEASDVNDVSFLINADVAENIARSAVTDTLKINAETLDKAGIETYVIRSGSGCCDWCDSMIGMHPVNDVPDDFWRVHKGCTCSFDYKCNGKHSRITFSTSDNGKIIKNTEKL